MRVEPYTLGSYVHVIKRGARGLNIVKDGNDKWRFVKSLYILNDSFFDQNWPLNTEGKEMFYRPERWPKQKQLVEVLAFTLLDNHFHLILKETTEGGITEFMKKLGQSMTNHYNAKYEEKGSIFQGAFRLKNCTDDFYLRYLFAYVMVKNVFEMFPERGLSVDEKDFEASWRWATSYPFSSLRDYAGGKNTPIVSKELFFEMFPDDSFKSYAKDVILSGKWKENLKELE